MVPMFEIAFLVVLVLLGIWWFTRSTAYRARRGSGADPGQHDAGARDSLTKNPPKGGPWA